MTTVEMDYRGERVVIDGVEYHVPGPVVRLLLERSRRMHEAEFALPDTPDEEDVERGAA